MVNISCFNFRIYSQHLKSLLSPSSIFSAITTLTFLISSLTSAIIFQIFCLKELILSFCNYIYFVTRYFNEAMFFNTQLLYYIRKSNILNLFYTYLFYSSICRLSYQMSLACYMNFLSTCEKTPVQKTLGSLAIISEIYYMRCQSWDWLPFSLFISAEDYRMRFWMGPRTYWIICRTLVYIQNHQNYFILNFTGWVIYYLCVKPDVIYFPNVKFINFIVNLSISLSSNLQIKHIIYNIPNYRITTQKLISSQMIPQQQQQRAFTLPIHKYKQQIIETIRKNKVTVICGETGSGKTTQVPQFLFNQYNRILITQPRRISAITLAQRVAYEMGCELGKEVGYNVRFQQKRTPDTRVTFMTDGMAIRQLMVRKHFDVFVLDEAHQRSINTDVLISVLKKILFQTSLKIKIVIMSATIDSAKFMNFYNTDALINIEGRSYPTEIYNLFQPEENYVDAMFNAIMQVHEGEEKGDVLAFLTGEEEINTLYKKIQKTKQQFNITNLRPLMLYSALPSEYQHQIFIPQKGDNPPRRVILATNIAQTSVTINGVRYVIDSGMMKIRVYDPLKMIDVLSIVPVSKANALQRAGRAGRQAKGKCFRLYLKNAFDELEDQMTPEILRSQLSGPVLQLKAIGIESILALDFMDRPSDTTLTSCLNLLRQIKCLKQNEQRITDYGFEVSKIPMPPILSHLLISSLEYKCSGIVLSMLSILSIENLFYSTSRQAQRDKRTGVYEILKKYLPIVNKSSLTSSATNSTIRNPTININTAYSNLKKDNSSTIMSDHLAKVNLLHQYINCKNRSVFCKQNMLNKNNIKRAVLIREQLEDYLKQIVAQRKKKTFFANNNNDKNQDKFSVAQTKLNPESISNWLKCMEKCSIYNTAKLSKDGFYLINKTGQKAYIHPESLCFYLKEKPSVIVFNQIVKTTKTYLRDITPIN